MSIKTRLNIILFLSVITIVGLYAYIVKITLEIDDEIEQLQKVEEFGESVSQLGLITEYYLTHHEERYIEAWIQLMNIIETLSVEVDDFRRYHIVRESSPSIRNAFVLIVRINREPETYPDPEMRSEILERASTRIRSDVRQLMTISYVVSENRLEKIRSLQVDQRLYYLFILVPVILALLIVAYFMRRLIINSINRLQEGTARFASGKLDERIELHGNDELSSLAVQFNSMAEELENLVEREKLLNNKLEMQAADLKKSNEELENFASVASHDLKEPLRMIRSFMELLEKKYGDQLDETANKYIRFAVDGSQRMTTLINDLLEFSRVGRVYNEFELVDLNQLLEEIIQFYEPQIEKNDAKVRFGAMPKVKGVEVSLKMVFQNLISNALKYQEKGSIPEIDIGVKDLYTHWQFSVKDNGIGIEEEYRDQVFLLFKRLHGSDDYPGTGMGLAVSKKIVEQHNGNIWVESEKGEGSTFYFTIPRNLKS
jgi:signal transduction histidine kinase